MIDQSPQVLSSIAPSLFPGSIPTATPTTTTSASPQPAAENNGLSLSDQVALGVGIPSAIFAFCGIGVSYLQLRRHSKHLARRTESFLHA